MDGRMHVFNMQLVVELSDAMDSEAWLCTSTGKRFDPLHPREQDVDLKDIAQGLSRKFRFGGQSRADYTVAEHSICVSRHFRDPVLALCGLLHDAAEAYLWDIQRPVKGQQYWFDCSSVPPRMRTFREVEDGIMEVVAKKFGVPWPFPHAIAEADLAELVRERRDLFPADQPDWNLPFASRENPIPLPTMSPSEAKGLWVYEFHDLVTRRFISTGM